MIWCFLYKDCQIFAFCRPKWTEFCVSMQELPRLHALPRLRLPKRISSATLSVQKNIPLLVAHHQIPSIWMKPPPHVYTWACNDERRFINSAYRNKTLPLINSLPFRSSICFVSFRESRLTKHSSVQHSNKERHCIHLCFFLVIVLKCPSANKI